MSFIILSQALKDIGDDEDDDKSDKEAEEIAEKIERKYKILLLTSFIIDAVLLILCITTLIKLYMKTRNLKWPSANAENGQVTPIGS